MDVASQIIGLKENDSAVIQYIYVSYYPKIERYVLDNNGTTDDARDVFQEAFVAVWRNLQMDRFEARNETALSGYLYQVARNKWLDQIRSVKNRKTTQLPEGALDQVPDEPVMEPEATEYLDKVKTQFASLGEPCRELLKRFYFKKESMREIAAHFSWTEASAKNNKYRCLQKLRNKVIEKDENDIP